jgi:hypothetical protein
LAQEQVGYELFVTLYDYGFDAQGNVIVAAGYTTQIHGGATDLNPLGWFAFGSLVSGRAGAGNAVYGMDLFRPNFGVETLFTQKRGRVHFSKQYAQDAQTDSQVSP